MASSGQGGGASDPGKNYNSDFVTQFADGDRKAKQHYIGGTQTQMCAELAATYYSNLKNVSVTVKEANMGDSFVCEGKYLGQGNDKYYYHAMFTATIGNNGNEVLFFAELEGKNYPQEVLQCVILEDEENEHKCLFCSSIYHPPGDYLGKKIN